MSGFTIDTAQLTKLGGYLGAMESEILASAPKAANSTATWLRRQFVDATAKLGPKKELIRQMTRITRAKQGRPIAELRPAGQRIYAASFSTLLFQAEADNPSRGFVEVDGFQKTTKAIGFVNTQADSGQPQPLRTNKHQPKKLAPALGPIPAMLFAEWMAMNRDMEDQIYLQLSSRFEDELTKAMNNR